MKSEFLLLTVVATFLSPVLFGASTPPAPIDTQTPIYPEVLLDSGRDGMAKLTFTVNERGLVENPVVSEASEPEFGEAALVAVREWRFRPATEDGKPVSKKVSLPFQFTAPPEKKLNAVIGRNVFQTIEALIVSDRDLDARPAVATRARPVYPKNLKGSGKDERVTLSVVIGPDGMVYNPEVVKISEKEFYLPALLAASKWTFEPPLKDGQPVYCQFDMTVWVYEGETPPGS